MSDYRKMGGGDFDHESIDEFSSVLPPEEKNRFLTRHKIRTSLGANDEFTGNGMTQTRAPNRRHGVVEALCIDRDPQPIKEMKYLKTIKLENRA